MRPCSGSRQPLVELVAQELQTTATTVLSWTLSTSQVMSMFTSLIPLHLDGAIGYRTDVLFLTLDTGPKTTIPIYSDCASGINLQR